MHVSPPCVLCWRQAAREGSTQSVTEQNCNILSSNCPLHNTTVLCRTVELLKLVYRATILPLQQRKAQKPQHSPDTLHKTVTEPPHMEPSKLLCSRKQQQQTSTLTSMFCGRDWQTSRQRRMSIFVRHVRHFRCWTIVPTRLQMEVQTSPASLSAD